MANFISELSSPVARWPVNNSTQSGSFYSRNDTRSTDFQRTDLQLPTNAKSSSIGAVGLEKRVQISVPSHPSIQLLFTVELYLPLSYSPH